MRLISVHAGLVLLLLLVVNVPYARGTASVGEPAPNFSLMKFDGDVFTLKDAWGKWVVINFWSIDCKPCVAELPELAEFSCEHGASAVVTAINVDGVDRAKVHKFVEESEVQGDLIWLCDPSGRILSKLTPPDYANNAGLPFTVVVSPHGSIVAQLLGKRDDIKSYLNGLVSAEYK